jgi:hypothetical protein
MLPTLALATLAVTSRPLLAADAHMTDAERSQIVQFMKDAQSEFVQAVEGLSDEQWKWKPTPERWSVGECAEHIVLSEVALFSRAEAALKSPPDPDWETKTKGKTEIILNVMAQRKGKAQAPEEIQPQGKMTRAEIMAKFAEVRGRSLRFIEETQLPLKEHLSPHPFPIFNPLNAYQWVLYIPLHNMRHDKQIEEVKATPGFPAKGTAP